MNNRIMAVAFISFFIGTIIGAALMVPMINRYNGDYQALAAKYNAEVELNGRLRQCVFNAAEHAKNLALQIPYLNKAEILYQVSIINSDAIGCVQVAEQ